MSNKTALERALPIVATAYGKQFGVEVVLSGNSARTDGETIVLPMLNNMSELKDVLFGYLAHEAAHVRDSDFKVIRKCKTPLEKSVLNIIEDIRIELLIQEAFPGTQFTLDAVWTHIVDNQMSPPATSDDNEATQLHQYLLHRLHHEVLKRTSGQELFESSQSVVEQTFPVGFFVRLDGLLGKYMPNLKTTNDCLKLARAVLKAIKDAEKEEQQNNQSQDPSQDDQGDGDGDGSQSMPMPSDNSDDQNNDQDSDSSDDAQQGNSTCNDQSDSSGDSSDDSSDQNAQSNQDGDDAQSDADSQDMPSNQQGQGSNSQDSDDSSDQKRGLAERMLDESDLPEDVMEQLKGDLEKEARDDGNGHFRIDASNIGKPSSNNGDVSSLQQGILTSSAIRSKLQGLLQAKTRDKQWLHTRGKRVDGKRLTRLAQGDSRVFIQREETKRTDTAVHILLDRSTSMTKIQHIANQATVSMAMAVSSIPKCDVAVSMFPGRGGEVSQVITRGQPIRPNLGRMAIWSDGCTPLAEAMLYAARELATSNRQRKVLIIITDGEPDNPGGVKYMNSVIADHVDTYAIGIGYEHVKYYFENWSVISDVKELQKALFDIAGKVLDLN